MVEHAEAGAIELDPVSIVFLAVPSANNPSCSSLPSELSKRLVARLLWREDFSCERKGKLRYAPGILMQFITGALECKRLQFLQTRMQELRFTR